MTKTGSWFALSTFAVAALWAAPAQANPCEEQYGACMENAASYEYDRWIQENLWMVCDMNYQACMAHQPVCGDTYCDDGWEDLYSCPEDCNF